MADKILEAFIDALTTIPAGETVSKMGHAEILRNVQEQAAKKLIAALDLWAEGNGLKRGHLRRPSLEEQYRAIAERMLSMHVLKVRGLRFDAADDAWVCWRSEDFKDGQVSIPGSDVAQEWRRENPPTGDGTFEIPEESREFHNKMEAAALTRVASTLLAAKAGGAVYGVQKQGEAWLGITEAGHLKHAINHAEVDEAYQAEIRMNKAHRPPDVRYAIQAAAERLLEKANNGRHVEEIEYHPLKDVWTAKCMGGTVTVLGVYVLEEAGLKRPAEEAKKILDRGATNG